MKARHLLSASTTGANAIFLPLLSSHCHQARCPSTPRLNLEARRTVGAWWCLLVSSPSKWNDWRSMKIWTLWGSVGIFGVLPAWACFFCILSLHFPWLHAYFDHLWSTSGKEKMRNKLLQSEPIWDYCSKSTWVFIFLFFNFWLRRFPPSSASHLFISLTCSFLWPSFPAVFFSFCLPLAFGLHIQLAFSFRMLFLFFSLRLLRILLLRVLLLLHAFSYSPSFSSRKLLLAFGSCMLLRFCLPLAFALMRTRMPLLCVLFLNLVASRLEDLYFLFPWKSFDWQEWFPHNMVLCTFVPVARQPPGTSRATPFHYSPGGTRHATQKLHMSSLRPVVFDLHFPCCHVNFSWPFWCFFAGLLLCSMTYPLPYSELCFNLFGLFWQMHYLQLSFLDPFFLISYICNNCGTKQSAQKSCA